jgi:hypothetical protein
MPFKWNERISLMSPQEGTRMANHTEMLRDDLLEQLDRQKAKNRQLTGVSCALKVYPID